MTSPRAQTAAALKRSRSSSTIADDRRAVAGAGGELAERGGVVGDETGLEHEVLGRVAGDRQLGEGDEVAPGCLRPLVGVGEQGEVAVEVADGRVELGQRDPNDRHGVNATFGPWTWWSCRRSSSGG